MRSRLRSRSALVIFVVLGLTAAPTAPAASNELGDVPPGYDVEVFWDGAQVPNDLAYDPTGGLFVSETGAGQVSRVAILPNGSRGDVEVIAVEIADSEGVALSDDGVLYVSNVGVVYRIADGTKTAFAAGFADAEGLAIDENGDLYVADDADDTGAIRVTRVEVLPDGTAGAATELLVVPGGSAGDIDFGPDGELFIASNAFGVWRVVLAPDGSVVSVDLFALVPGPFSLAFDASGTLYGGTTDGEIWAIEPSGDVSLFAGALGSAEGLAFDDSGRLYVSNPFGNHVLRIAPTSLEVGIDVKPGSDTNPVNLKSEGVIPVAILTTDDFDATTVDSMSVAFGPAGASEAHGRGHFSDVDYDGDIDLMLHFRTQETGIQPGDTEACLTAQTFEGQPITGCDLITVTGGEPQRVGWRAEG